MTRQPSLPDDASRQAERLDAFLDGLAHSGPVLPPDLDPSLAATVRQFHALARQGTAADIRHAGKARRWEHLMQTPMKSSVVTPFPSSRTLPPSAPMPVAPRPVNRPSRLRRLGSGTLGLVATLTLVLLLAASSLAVYLSAPQNGDEPTMLPAALGATPEETPVVMDSDVDPDFIDTYPDLIVPYLTTCDGASRSLQYLSDVVSLSIQPNSHATPRLSQTSEQDRPALPRTQFDYLNHGTGGASLATPVGDTVDLQSQVAIADTWSRYRSCVVSNEWRRAAIFMSDDALIRLVYREEIDLVAVSLLSAEPRHGDRLPRLDQRDQFYIADFQSVDMNQVVASVLIERQGGGSIARLEVSAYVVFVRQADIWLVDEILQFQG